MNSCTLRRLLHFTEVTKDWMASRKLINFLWIYYGLAGSWDSVCGIFKHCGMYFNISLSRHFFSHLNTESIFPLQNSGQLQWMWCPFLALARWVLRDNVWPDIGSTFAYHIYWAPLNTSCSLKSVTTGCILLHFSQVLWLPALPPVP